MPPPPSPRDTSTNILSTPWATELKPSDKLNELILKNIRDRKTQSLKLPFIISFDRFRVLLLGKVQDY